MRLALNCWFVNQNDEFVVVLPACNKDGRLLLKNLNWMQQLDGVIPYSCIISEDAGMNRELSQKIVTVAGSTFKSCSVFTYPAPPIAKWPQAPNWAFQKTALHMQQLKLPWLWMEPDMIPLKSGWCRILQVEYRNCGQPMMGSFIAGRDHMNGTAIYPPYFPELSKEAMTCVDTAWDFVMRHDTMDLSYNAVHLMHHCWGVINGKPNAVEGKEPSFQTVHQVRDWIPKSAVTFHRCKDGSLISRLMELKYANSNLHPVLS